MLQGQVKLKEYPLNPEAPKNTRPVHVDPRVTSTKTREGVLEPGYCSAAVEKPCWELCMGELGKALYDAYCSSSPKSNL